MSINTGGRHNQGEQGSEGAVYIPHVDSADSLFLGALSAEHPKSKTTAKQPGRAKVVTELQLTAEPLCFTNTLQP